MGIAITEDHLELSNVVRSFLTAHKARAAARELLDASSEEMPTFWGDLAALGWLGLHIPEEHGGSGFGLPELVVVVEGLGGAVAPGPFVPTVVASAIIAAHGSSEQRARWLPGLTDGSIIAGLGFSAVDIALSDGSASGDAGVVLAAPLADLLVIAHGKDVWLVEAKRPGVTIDVPTSLDPTRRSGRLRFDAVAIDDADILSGSQTAATALARTIVSAEAVGGAQDCVNAAVEYAKVRQQFGRTIGTFQAVKHHLANMLVTSEAALSAVWDAARCTDPAEFELMAACAASLAVPAYVHNAEMNIQVHGGVGFTWEHDAHLHLRRATTLRALFGGPSAAETVLALTADGVTRENSVDLPPEAEKLRAQIRADVAEMADLDEVTQRQRMVETGYVMPHWPAPWGRGADAIEQLVIEEEFAAAGIKRRDFGITGWVILTLIQHGTPEQIERFVNPALRGEEVWCQLFSEPEAGSDAAGLKTKAVGVDGGWIIDGQKVWTSGAQNCQRGLATVRTDFEAPKHAGISTVIIDMADPGVQVRPLRQITGGSDFNEVFLTDVFVPDADVVGAPNSGWTVARATLGNERVSIGRRFGWERGCRTGHRQLTDRFGDRVEGARAKAGMFLANDQALRLLNLRSAARSIVGGGPGPEGNVTKLLRALHMGDRATLAAELIGPEVALVSGRYKIAGLMVLAARGMTIAGGTSEVTRNQIAERILGLPRDPLIT